MSLGTTIEWTQATWNPVTGCTKVSSGCEHCYAERLAKRLQAMGNPNYRNGFQVTLHPHMLELPCHWRTSRLVFVDSMGDLFHEEVPTAYIQQVFQVMERCPQHTFQLLTKRSARLPQLNALLPWPDNVWLGVTVENNDYMYRLDDLRATHAATRFLSFEPLLGPIDSPDLTDITWAIVGGESGPGARPMKHEWVANLRDTCVAQRVSFFFKQWGGLNKKKAGRLLDGRMWSDRPSAMESSIRTQIVRTRGKDAI